MSKSRAEPTFQAVLIFCFILLVGVVVTQRRLPFYKGLELVHATDTKAYLTLASAAPGLPSKAVDFQHAQRIFIHYIAGLTHLFSSLSIETIYLCFVGILFIGILGVLHAWQCYLQTGHLHSALVSMVVLGNPYLLRYFFLAPPMVADLLFMFGLCVVILGLFRVSWLQLLTGLFVATLGRQTSPILLLGVAWCLFLSSDWRMKYSNIKRFGFFVFAIFAVAIPLKSTSYVAQVLGAEPWIEPRHLVSLFEWLFSNRFSWAQFSEHVLRVFLPSAIPLALLISSRDKRRLLSKGTAQACLLMGLTLLAIPLLCSPEIELQNQSRQAASGAICFLAAFLPETDESDRSIQSKSVLGLGLITVFLFISSLHHVYSNITVLLPNMNAMAFAVLHLGSAVCIGSTARRAALC